MRVPDTRWVVKLTDLIGEDKMRDFELKVVAVGLFLAIILMIVIVSCAASGSGGSYYHIPGTPHSTSKHKPGVNKPATRSNPWKGGSTRRR